MRNCVHVGRPRLMYAVEKNAFKFSFPLIDNVMQNVAYSQLFLSFTYEYYVNFCLRYFITYIQCALLYLYLFSQRVWPYALVQRRNSLRAFPASFAVQCYNWKLVAIFLFFLLFFFYSHSMCRKKRPFNDVKRQ